VKTERRAPLVEITAKFNDERNVSVSKPTVRRRLRNRGFSRRVCRKKVVIKFDNRKND
jgi:predicted GNAT family acetyltransferase